MKNIAVITTGGTIAMRADEVAGGAIPSLSASDLSQGVAGGIANVRFQEFCNLPSAHLTLDLIWKLSREIARLLSSDGTDGIVVTHGTDTVEETAFLCDLTVDSDKPIVFTGAMRLASEVGYEGFANLTNAVRTASAEEARGLGTLVVFNDSIHAAKFVTKTNTTNLDTFKSPNSGPIGFLDYGGVVFQTYPLGRQLIPATRLETDVHLLKLAIGIGPQVLRLLSDTGVHGIVIEALGGGRVPPDWLPAIESTLAQGIPIVITSRAGTGRTVDLYGYGGGYRDLSRLGCWFGGDLNGQKARIKLMAALGTENPSMYFAPYN